MAFEVWWKREENIKKFATQNLTPSAELNNWHTSAQYQNMRSLLERNEYSLIQLVAFYLAKIESRNK